MINPQTAWQEIKLNAEKAFAANTIWHSLRQHRAYQIQQVLVDRIVIMRQGNSKPQELTEATIQTAAQAFNNQNCRVQRRTLISPTVAEETAFVFLHPKLGWEADGSHIIQTVI